MLHNGVNFCEISTSQSRPNVTVFDTLYSQMCFAPQQRALFRHLNFEKCSGAEGFLYMFMSTCALGHNGVNFFHISTSKSALMLSAFATSKCQSSNVTSLVSVAAEIWVSANTPTKGDSAEAQQSFFPSLSSKMHLPCGICHRNIKTTFDTWPCDS